MFMGLLDITPPSKGMVGIVAISALLALEMLPAVVGLVIIVQLPDKVIVVVADHQLSMGLFFSEAKIRLIVPKKP
jgi:hypothetical protein